MIGKLGFLDNLKKFIMEQQQHHGDVHGSEFTAEFLRRQREECSEEIEKFEKSAESPQDEIACRNWCKGSTSAPGSEVDWVYEESEQATAERDRALSAAREKLLEEERAKQTTSR